MQKIIQLYLSQELCKEEKLKGNCALTATKAKAIGPSSCSSAKTVSCPWKGRKLFGQLAMKNYQ
jgi:hypothetical protein